MPEPRRRSHRPSKRVIREFNDRGTLWLLEDPINFHDLLQVIAPDLADQLDFSRAVRVNRSFIPADLQKRESDLIFRVPFLERPDREVWVYLLLEHQSEPDPSMPLRIYLYMGQIWDTQQRAWHDLDLPPGERRLDPIIPAIFYTGTRTWSAPPRLADLMDVPALATPFVPHWETLFLNLHETPPETLTRFATAVGWTLQVMQAEQAPLAELERVLTEAMAGLEGLSEEQRGQWQRAAWFLVLLVYHRRNEEESEQLIDEIRERAEESKFRIRKELATMEKSYAQVLEARGQLRFARSTLQRLLAAKFGALPDPLATRIAATDDLDRLSRALEQVVIIDSLDELEL